MSDSSTSPSVNGPGIDRRRLLFGAAGVAVAGAAGAGVAHLLDDDAPAVTLAAGARGPWTYVAPGQDIAAAIDAGARLIQLGAGDYRVRTTVSPPRGASLRGVGQATRLVADADLESVVGIGSTGPVDGVAVSSLVVDCAQRAQTGIAVTIDGRTGNYQDEPDPVIRLDDLWVYDAAADGVAYRGADVRSCTTSRVRVRRAGRHGFHIEASDSWWIACEATTTGPGAASAGFMVAGANNFFEACKAWYCADHGWHVRGTRNKFIGCESQDTRSHGWLVAFDRNTYVGCVADTAAMFDVGGKRGEADGFHILAADESSFVGCQSFDRRPSGRPAHQRYGFHIPAEAVRAGRLVAPTGWDNLQGLIGP